MSTCPKALTHVDLLVRRDEPDGGRVLGGGGGGGDAQEDAQKDFKRGGVHVGKQFFSDKTIPSAQLLETVFFGS